MRLSIKKRKVNKAHVLRFKGRLDVLGSREMPPGLVPFTKKHLGTVVVDLSESSFVDSLWLAVFIRFNELSQLNDNALFFFVPEGTIYDLFESTGLTKVLKVISSLDQLPASMQK